MGKIADRISFAGGPPFTGTGSTNTSASWQWHQEVWVRHVHQNADGTVTVHHVPYGTRDCGWRPGVGPREDPATYRLDPEQQKVLAALTFMGLPRTASPADAKARYRELAKVYHPDAPDGDAAKMKALNNAYDVLTAFEQKRMKPR
jgi:hypothetical protein